ncbi:hypothetical protein [Poseidonibacter ostreae]|jgi:hypothetical protein|uniref:Uncharacterized protein n=1 Tax=Poseidonibacter ostreae TaxID=2654171 RepID=A0A6L4WWJ2_9BACT|nr:hypothetical protein [Poseidonibacter ostreae]KAB7887973.1 hypothetical protein GA417_01025 [Poseidonibacter ostreae]KAB7891108.1 hypothetical protein GBG19_01710 [Poseidonibacter ostreae]KAB7892832.1 hypothetical protein GBG18_01420 [Poseidonibacter ostreae]
MNNFPSQDEVVEAVLTGIKTAKSNYSFWTADDIYLSYAPPKFLTIHVSQEIAKLSPSPEIFIDATIADILRCSLPKRDAFKWFMAENNIAQDVICLTLDERFVHKSDNDSISKVIMSIRNGVRNAQTEYKDDIELMCKLLQREKQDESTLDYGVFAFYMDISNTARKKSEKRLEEIIEAFNKIVASHKNLKSSFKGGDINKIDNVGEWCVGCYIIEPTV